MKITEYLKNNRLYLDGGMGTLLQEAGLRPGELPERWNITNPQVIKNIHKAYFDAGSNVVNTNTFGANPLKFSQDELRLIIEAAVENARSASLECRTSQPRWVALDIGPLGKMLKPYGELDFEDAVEAFAKTVRIGARAGVDLIFIETMGDTYETKAALLAAKENSDLPVFVSNAYGADGKLMTGANPEAVIAMLEGMGADAIGINCSLGPTALCEVIKSYINISSLPIIFKPNAGLPHASSGKTVYDISPEEFAEQMVNVGGGFVRAVGGCCGTSPEYISGLVSAMADIPLSEITEKSLSLVSSYTHAVRFDKAPVLIGERINPTGKSRFKEALRNEDMDYILKEGIAEEEAGAHILDVNVGLPEIDEAKMLVRAICELQAVTDLPLQIDTANPEAMAAALRRYNGKAMINSVNGKRESMEAIFPLVKKYGGVVVALTLDEGGIPKSAEGRFEIAKNILAEAEKWGIDKKDIIFDPLAMAVSADKNAAAETLRCVELITSELRCKTSLGVSNVSFGLPARDAINSSFFTAAMFKGLSAAIINPYSEDMIKSYRAYLALCGLDDNFSGYISYAEKISGAPDNLKNAVAATDGETLMAAIVKGRHSAASDITHALLNTCEPLTIVNEHIISALNTVGVGFEKKTVYLPQLLMSAEAAKSAFEVIKSAMSDSAQKRKTKIVIATVKGDIHDIGKNIVKLLLENYGFTVADLGHDVECEDIAKRAEEIGAGLVALSALMTTTVPAMEKTIKILRERMPSVKIMVGGAVLTADYARSIGADFYGADAMEAVRLAELVDSQNQ